MSNHTAFRATEKQLAFIDVLLQERLDEEGRRKAYKAMSDGLDRDRASRWITDLKARPVLAAAQPNGGVPAQGALPKVPNGHYALMIDGVYRFFKVNTPTSGRFDGFVFVDAQASDDYFPIKNRAKKHEILTAIAADVRGALSAYGHELGKCGVCNRTLTDPVSIEQGIGPVCIQKAGL
jgi:hypothetical protein